MHTCKGLQFVLLCVTLLFVETTMKLPIGLEESMSSKEVAKDVLTNKAVDEAVERLKQKDIELPEAHPTKEEKEWLRQYKMHQEGLLYSRINIFLLSVSLIAAIFMTSAASIFKGSLEAHWLLQLLILFLPILGLCLTLAWWFAACRQKEVVDFYSKMQKRSDPFYEWLSILRREIRDTGKKKCYFNKRGQKVLVNLLPKLFFIFWLLALAWTVKKLWFK